MYRLSFGQFILELALSHDCCARSPQILILSKNRHIGILLFHLDRFIFIDKMICKMSCKLLRHLASLSTNALFLKRFHLIMNYVQSFWNKSYFDRMSFWFKFWMIYLEIIFLKYLFFVKIYFVKMGYVMYCFKKSSESANRIGII